MQRGPTPAETPVDDMHLGGVVHQQTEVGHA